MIPKADGDSTPLGQRSLGVLPVIYWTWASLGLGHLRKWVVGWLPRSVFSLGNSLSSVEAWFSTALEIEEVLSGIGEEGISCMLLMSPSLSILSIGLFWKCSADCPGSLFGAAGFTPLQYLQGC